MENFNNSVKASSTDTKACNKFYILDNDEKMYSVHTIEHIVEATNVGSDEDTAIKNAISWFEYCLDSDQTDNIQNAKLMNDNGYNDGYIISRYLSFKYCWNDVTIEGDNITIKFGGNLVAIINNEDSECVGVEIYLCNGQHDYLVNDTCCSLASLDEAFEYVATFDVDL